MDLSIIVPIYNTKEELLIRCLSSIQQINGVEFECILIDDGSSEEVEALCCDFLEKDSRFLYYRKENGGVSSARNEGVRRASGQFLCFVDADDVVVPKAFSTPDVLNPNYDVTFTDLEEVCGDKRTVWSAFTSPGDINYETVIRRMMENGTLNGPYCKIYKRSFLQTVGVQFREDMIQGEDAVFFYEILAWKPVMRYLNIVSYNYHHSFIHSNGRLLREPMRCLDNMKQHYCVAIRSIQQGQFSQRERDLLKSNRGNEYVHDLFFRALDCIENNILTADIQSSICQWACEVKETGIFKLHVNSRIMLALLRIPDWTTMRVIEHLRGIYYRAKGIR